MVGTVVAATAVVGRFMCGWGCHLVAYQDLSSWLMKKIGLKPKPFRSRILVLAPLALAVYMFVWPTAYRWWVGAPRPELQNHLLKAEFWETFPGPFIAVATVLVCGFVAVYFLGAKGFCTYACPYGGFFRLLDQGAPGSIRVTDACKHCGHCTATCTSNVRVHEEVAAYGMVVDPGCMKCMDCITVCPNDALYVGFGRPSLLAKPKGSKPKRHYDFALWEECLAAVLGIGALLSFRGLYDQIPLLLAMAMGAITAVLAIKSTRLLRDANVRLQNRQLKRGGRLTRSGLAFSLFILALLTFTAHSAFVRYHAWRGTTLLARAAVGDEVWSPDGQWWDDASAQQRSQVQAATLHLSRADRWGLLDTPSVLTNLVWSYLASERDEEAQAAARRLIDLNPDRPDPQRGLAGILRKNGHTTEAERYYRKALALDPQFDPARRDLISMLVGLDRLDDAIDLYREGIDLAPDEMHWRIELARLFLDHGRPAEAKIALLAPDADEPGAAREHSLYGLAELQLGNLESGVASLRRAVELDPTLADAHYNLGMALLGRREMSPAIQHLQTTIELNPSLQPAHYNLAVATFMSGRPEEALPHIREAIRLNPNDADANGFLAEVLKALSDRDDARDARRRAEDARTLP